MKELVWMLICLEDAVTLGMWGPEVGYQYGQFCLLIEKLPVDMKDTFAWLQAGDWWPVRTGCGCSGRRCLNWVKLAMHSTLWCQSHLPRICVCCGGPETVTHMVSGFSAQALHEDVYQHNHVAFIVHWNVCRHHVPVADRLMVPASTGNTCDNRQHTYFQSDVKIQPLPLPGMWRPTLLICLIKEQEDQFMSCYCHQCSGDDNSGRMHQTNHTYKHNWHRHTTHYIHTYYRHDLHTYIYN